MNILLAFTSLIREATEVLFSTKEGQKALKTARETSQDCAGFGGKALRAAGRGLAGEQQNQPLFVTALERQPTFTHNSTCVSALPALPDRLTRAD